MNSKSDNNSLSLSFKDIDVLRRLGHKKMALSKEPCNLERRKAWYAFDSGEGDRVMVLAEHHGIKDRIRPVHQDDMEAESEWARGVELTLRNEIYQHEVLKDDHVIEPFINLNWKVSSTDFGVAPVVHYGGDENLMGSRRWDAPIGDLDKDFDKLQFRTFSVDRDATFRERARLENIFKELIPVRMRSSFYWTMGLTGIAINLIGLENLMIAMYDNPEGLHRLMTFLRDDSVNFIDWLEEEGLFSLNNENDYIGSGSIGYTRELPKEGDDPDRPVKRDDLWVLSESQETVGVGPELFEKFIFPYQQDIAESYGKTYYGCCEPVHTRWDVIKKISNLERVSVSPWADMAFMAEALGRRYVFSRKPKPTLISTPRFNEELIRKDIRDTLDIAGGCRLEIVMKDVHTLSNEPYRLARWVEIAREEIAK